MGDLVKIKEEILSLAYAKQFAAATERAELFLLQMPNDAEIMGILAGIYIETERFDLAQQWVEKALQADRSYVFAYFLQARIKHSLGDWQRAQEILQWLLDQYGKQVSAEMVALVCNLLAHINKWLGNIELAAQYSLRASQSGTMLFQKTENYSNYLFNLNYLDHVSDCKMFEEHKKYNDFFANITQYQHKNLRSHKKIRVGYISPDFRRHVVVHFIYQLLNRYNSKQFTVICYAKGKADHITAKLKTLVDGWRDISSIDDASAAKMIYDDEIDLLVDFSGHTKNNVLPILAYKPAPIQLSGIGYFNTTGLQTIDYFITDCHVDPVGQNDELFTEKLLRLPQSHFCYTPPASMPECEAAPYLKNGYITFGSFNNFSKVTDKVLRVWFEIMKRVQGSKLVLKSSVFATDDAKNQILKRMYKVGFTQEQLDLRPETMPYLPEYNDIDIALDTFPYPGGGTTCEALYMGVPVITLAGKRHGSRFGYSLLKNIKLEECIAFSKAEYIQKAVKLANHMDKLIEIRKNLRKKMQNSAVMNGLQYVADVEQAYEAIWTRYIVPFLPKNKMELTAKATECIAEGDYCLALACANQILFFDEKSCEGLYIKAISYLELGKYQQAIDYVHQIININERYSKAYLILAHIYRRQGLIKDEVELLEMVIALLDGIPKEEWSKQDKNAYSEAWSLLDSANSLLGNYIK